MYCINWLASHSDIMWPSSKELFINFSLILTNFFESKMNLSAGLLIGPHGKMGDLVGEKATLLVFIFPRLGFAAFCLIFNCESAICLMHCYENRGIVQWLLGYLYFICNLVISPICTDKVPNTMETTKGTEDCLKPLVLVFVGVVLPGCPGRSREFA